MKKVTYLSLDKSVLQNGIGGASHIKGVLSTLLMYFSVSYMGHASYLLNSIHKNLSLYELEGNFYLEVLKAIWKDKETEFFLIRKTLLGMYLLIPIILLKKLIGSKQVFILEFNGISGDYSGRSAWFLKLMLFLNVFPLFFYDGVYCVLDDIANRLKAIYNSNKIFVCPNGGPEPAKHLPCVGDIERVNLIYYGSDLAHYHLNWFASVIDEYNKVNFTDIKLILVGPNNENINGKCVMKASARPAKEFQSFIAKMVGKNFGLIPLNLSESSNTIEPIKTFDYLSANIPIVHSSACLNGFGASEVCYMYQPDFVESLTSLLDKIIELPASEVQIIYKEIAQIYTAYTWPNRLKKLVEFISGENKKSS